MLLLLLAKLAITGGGTTAAVFPEPINDPGSVGRNSPLLTIPGVVLAGRLFSLILENTLEKSVVRLLEKSLLTEIESSHMVELLSSVVVGAVCRLVLKKFI